MTIAVLVLSGCAMIPNVPTQNILMFSGDGKLVDPTGNLNCTEGGSSRGPLCHETKPENGTFTHVGAVGYTALEDSYYENTYLKSLFECMHEYFRSSPDHPPGSSCRQEPSIVSRPAAPTDVKRLLIFAHGGLNTQIGSIQRVVKREAREPKQTKQEKPTLYNEIAGAGYYPLFINWRASFTSNYLDGLLSIRQGEKKRMLGPATAPVVLFVDVGRSITRAPLVWAAQGVNALKTTPGFSFLESRDPDAVATELICEYEYLDPKACREKFRFKKAPFCVPFNVRSKEDLAGNRDFGKLNAPSARTLAISVGEDLRRCPEMAVSFMTYLVTLPSRLLLDAFVDGMGTSAWDIMLRRTRLLFNRDDEFRHPRLQRGEQQPGDGPMDGLANIPRRGGVSTFLRQLENEIKLAQAKDDHKWRITLVGHSMGAIIVNQILREWIQLKLKLPIKNIVYMAAAAPVRDVLDSVLPYLRKDREAQFYNLMLHPVADAREQYKVSGIPIDPGPRGSLLVLIDNFLSKPLTYLDRTAGRYENFLPAVHNIPRDLWPRIHIKTFSVGQDVREENPQRHGEFTSRFKFWIPECWEPKPAMGSKTPRDCVYDP